MRALRPLGRTTLGLDLQALLETTSEGAAAGVAQASWYRRHQVSVVPPRPEPGPNSLLMGHHFSILCVSCDPRVPCVRRTSALPRARSEPVTISTMTGNGMMLSALARCRSPLEVVDDAGKRERRDGLASSSYLILYFC